MGAHQENMYFDGPSNHSFNPMALNRQPMRPFDGYGQVPPMYHADRQPEESYRYATQSQRRSPPVDSYTNGGWSYNGPATHASTMGRSSGARTSAQRPPIPTPWMDAQTSQFTALPMQIPASGQMMPFSNEQTRGHYSQGQSRAERTNGETEEEELIPTAIVIKNIPFALHKDQLCDLMISEGLPLPYAFNYHFEGGTFRGLAFANYSTPEETKMVIDRMDGFPVTGRRLRVEYKRMLPAKERARIEREKREKRGQLEEQHRAGSSALSEQYRALGGLRTQPSMSSISSAYPANSPPSPGSVMSGQSTNKKVDMNDPDAFHINDELLKFQLNDSLQTWQLSPAQNSKIRSIIHELAERRGLRHKSAGSGENRYVVVYKERHEFPSMPGSSFSFNESRGRGLARAATMDFSEGRDSKFPNLRKQTSALLDIPSSPGLNGINGQRGLREAKSYSDLQGRAGSPFGNSTPTFPAELRSNLTRFAEYGLGGNQNVNSTNNGLLMNGRDETHMTNTFSNMSLGYDRPLASSRINGRTGVNGDSSTTAGAIGSQRSLNGLNGNNGNNDDATRNGASAAPERQPRGPGSEWGPGFTRSRQNGHAQRSSGELDANDVDLSSSSTAQTPSRHL